MLYKPRALLQIDALKVGSRTESVVLSPRVIDAKWTKNNHLVADELTVTIGWREGGVDPRFLKNARGAFWFWDANYEDFDRTKHLRFTGIAKKVARRLGEGDWVVDITFHDYTTLFINNKPLKTVGMPEWSDTLQVIWEKICDNTGWQDPATGKILSSVEALKPNLIFKRADLAGRSLGEIVNERFRRIGKPTPKRGASSWDVWQWCICALGLVSYIEKDTCVVTDTVEHYGKSNAARAVYGHNIHTFEEDTDTDITTKGILLKSLDPLTGRTLEAFYPLPGDARLKARRAAVGKKSEEGATVTANEQSADYEEYNRFDITNQQALERAAQEAYEERSRQELIGSFKTAEMRLWTTAASPTEELSDIDRTGSSGVGVVDICDLTAGDAISVELEPSLNREKLQSLAGEEERVRYLVDVCDYDEDVARLIAKNFDADEFKSQLFHVRTLELDFGPDRCEFEVKFHNLVFVNT